MVVVMWLETVVMTTNPVELIQASVFPSHLIMAARQIGIQLFVTIAKNTITKYRVIAMVTLALVFRVAHTVILPLVYVFQRDTQSLAKKK